MFEMTGFLLAILTGFLVLQLMRGRGERIDLPLDLFLSFGLGVGLYSQITFYQVVVCDGFDPHLLLVFAGLFLLIVILKLLRRKESFIVNAPSRSAIISFLLLMVPVLFFVTAVSINLPYGDWDAWSLWNFRANAIYRSADTWWPVFHNEMQGKHPWLLPFWTVWGWGLAGHETVIVPIFTTLFMTMSVVGVLVFGLACFIPFKYAFLAGLFLVSVPFFIYHCASQYADIFTAFYLLSAAVALRLFLAHNMRKHLLLFAAFLAFLAFSKDEGIVLAFLMAIFSPVLVTNNPFTRRSFLVLFGVLFMAVIYVEILMRTQVLPATVIWSPYSSLDLRLLFDLSRWIELIRGVGRLLVMEPRAGCFMLLLAVAGVLTSRKPAGLFLRFLARVLGGFFLLFAFLYVGCTTDLDWRMSVTMSRLVYQIMPVAVFYMFLKVFAPVKELP